MLLDDAAEQRVSEHYARIWTSLKLRFTAKYFSEGALLSNSASSTCLPRGCAAVPLRRLPFVCCQPRTCLLQK